MSTPGSSVQVRLLIFSGRPDPEWGVDAAALEALSERVRAAVGKERAYATEPGGVGYRGFLLQHEEAELDLPRHLVVFHGVIIERPGPAATYWRDVAGVEDWLLEDAWRRGHGEVLAEAGVPEPGRGEP
jgi:hypothetical protein